MKKGKQNIRTIIILICVCVVLAAAYVLITANEDPAAAGMLIKLSGDSIAEVKIDNEYGSFVFEQQDGAWVVESDGVYRTNPEKMNLLLGCLEEFRIDRMLPDEKSEYGFDKPQAKVDVTTRGGREYSFVVGNEAIKGSSVYIKSNGQIMLTPTGMTSQLTGSLAAYRAKDVLMVDPSAIRSFDYYIEGQKTLSITDTDYQNWTMNYPFEAPARKVIMNELISKLRSLVIAGYVDTGVNVEETGLANPTRKMVLTDEAGVQQTLEFGAISGNQQYVRIGTKDDIVKLYTIDLDFSNITPQGVMYFAPLNIGTSEAQSLSIQAGGAAYNIDLKHNGQDITANVNGKEISFSDFISIYYKYIALNADGYDTEQAEPGECEAVCTTTLISGKKIELSLYRRDADTLYMYVNGQMLTSGQMSFYTERNSLTELLYRLQSITNL